MTDEELAAIRARAEAATPGPWAVSYAVDGHIGLEGTLADAAFVTAARHEVPALLAEVERLWAENAAMREIVQAVADGQTRHVAEADRWVLAFDNPTLSYAQEIWQKARALLAAP